MVRKRWQVCYLGSRSWVNFARIARYLWERMCSFRGEPLIYPPCTGATHRLVSPHPRFHVGQSLAFVLQVWTIDYEFRYLILFCLFPKYYVICHSSSTLWNHNINTKHSVVSFLFIINYLILMIIAVSTWWQAKMQNMQNDWVRRHAPLLGIQPWSKPSVHHTIRCGAWVYFVRFLR